MPEFVVLGFRVSGLGAIDVTTHTHTPVSVLRVSGLGAIDVATHMHTPSAPVGGRSESTA
jgi:hypothetical protein